MGSSDFHKFSSIVGFLFRSMPMARHLGEDTWGVHLKKGTYSFGLFLLFFRIVWHGLSTHCGLWPSLCTAPGWYYLRCRPRLTRRRDALSPLAFANLSNFGFEELLPAVEGGWQARARCLGCWLARPCRFRLLLAHCLLAGRK